MTYRHLLVLAAATASVPTVLACSSSADDDGTGAAEAGTAAPGADAGGASDASTTPPPSVSFVVNGHTLGTQEREALTTLARDVVPRMTGSREERVMLVARGAWWALKEGTWGQPLAEVYAYSNCNTASGDEEIGPLETCATGRAWQVGMAAVQVPNHTTAELEALAKTVFSTMTLSVLLADTAVKAGQPKSVVDAIVGSTGSLRTSWLLRVPALGMAAVVPGEVVPECIEGTKSWCFGSGWEETKKFAPTKAAALVAIEDLRRILAALAP